MRIDANTTNINAKDANDSRIESGEDGIVLKDLSYQLGGLFFKTQNDLGRYRREFQYAEYFEKLLKEHSIMHKREYLIPVPDKAVNRVDFMIADQILIDFKAKPFITREDYYQMRRYLEIAKFKLGLIVNFRQTYLKPKRILNSQVT